MAVAISPADRSLKFAIVFSFEPEARAVAASVLKVTQAGGV
jgi:hypothetical protein